MRTGSFIRSFVFFFFIFFALEAVYRLFSGSWPADNVAALIIVPAALILAAALAGVINRYRSQRVKKG